MKHTLKYTTEELGNSIQEAIGTIFANALKKKSDGFISLSGKDKWNNIDKITQPIVVTPCLFNLTNVKWDEIDKYTLEDSCDDPVARLCGNYVIGNFTDVLFPKYDPKQDNMFTDVMSACVASAFKGEFQSSFAYLRFGQMLLSLLLENSDRIVETDSAKRQLNSTLFKL